jgi:4'-phosphopantetheinyl transferase EntD
LPDEAHLVRNAIASRQREFALGRSCARRALAQFGVPPIAIGVDAKRAPSWPAGFVGSITHCRGFVGALVARTDCLRAIGFDAELAEPLAPDLVRLICTEAELEWMRTNPTSTGPGWEKVLFSAKEAVHKCISPLYGAMLDFLDVALFPGPDDRSLHARIVTRKPEISVDLSEIRVRFALTDRFVFSCAVVPQLPPLTTNPQVP